MNMYEYRCCKLTPVTLQTQAQGHLHRASDASDARNTGKDDAHERFFPFSNMACICVCVISIHTWKFVKQKQKQAQGERKVKKIFQFLASVPTLSYIHTCFYCSCVCIRVSSVKGLRIFILSAVFV